MWGPVFGVLTVVICSLVVSWFLEPWLTRFVNWCNGSTPALTEDQQYEQDAAADPDYYADHYDPTLGPAGFPDERDLVGKADLHPS
jgi:hypothetical protein